GKYDENTTFDDLRAEKPEFKGEAFKENLKKVDKLREIAQEHGVDVAHIVLAYYLTKPSLDVIIPGAKRGEQVIDNLKTLEVNLTEENIQLIESLFPIA
ncbi:aldo/keto reductase, partial [Staphylococcus aureus]|nr:aldo/keto reductase [Staphylococcus aureus]